MCTFSSLNASCPAVRSILYYVIKEQISIYEIEMRIIIMDLNQICFFQFRMLLALRGEKLKCLIFPLLMERRLLGSPGIGRYVAYCYQSTKSAFQTRMVGSAM